MIDDAVHIAAPWDSHRSLCGQSDVRLVPREQRPNGWDGCWSCLKAADWLAVNEGDDEAACLK